MPYVDTPTRDVLDRGAVPLTSGQLNYSFTRMIIEYLEDKGLSYTAINDVLGALDGARAEFYRRVAQPYENRKRRENGDVYPRELTLEVIE